MRQQVTTFQTQRAALPEGREDGSPRLTPEHGGTHARQKQGADAHGVFFLSEKTTLATDDDPW